MGIARPRTTQLLPLAVAADRPAIFQMWVITEAPAPVANAVKRRARALPDKATTVVPAGATMAAAAAVRAQQAAMLPMRTMAAQAVPVSLHLFPAQQSRMRAAAAAERPTHAFTLNLPPMQADRSTSFALQR